MSEFAPQPEPFERDSTVTSRQILDLFEAIDSYNSDRFAFLHSIAVLWRDSITQDDTDELLQRLDIIEEEADDGYALGREMLQLVHGTALRGSGLAFGEGDYVMVHLVDGAAFARAIAIPPAEPESRQLLHSHLDERFNDWLKVMRDTAINDDPKRAMAIMDIAPNILIAAKADENTEDLRTVSQLLQHGPTLAASLETFGLNGCADELRRVATFANDTDLLPWAIASHYGLLPETAPEKDPSLGRWTHWQEPADWAPVFRLLRAANPAGEFLPYLKCCALAGIDGRIAACRRKLDEDFSDFIDFYDELDDTLGITDSDMRQEYTRMQASAQSSIDQLTHVKQELQRFLG